MAASSERRRPDDRHDADHGSAHDPERFEVAYRAFVAALPDGEAPAQREVAKLLGAAERALGSTVPVGVSPSG